MHFCGCTFSFLLGLLLPIGRAIATVQQTWPAFHGAAPALLSLVVVVLADCGPFAIGQRNLRAR